MDIREYIKKSIDVKSAILNDDNFISKIQNCADIITAAYKNNKKVLIMGNGGSAADSNHIATEFLSKFLKQRRALSAVSLASNQSAITAVANDYDYSEIFSRQIEALGEQGDILIGISTSGYSKNVLNGFKIAKEKGLKTIFLSGQNAGFEADYNLKVPSDMTSIIQEAHITIAHVICAVVEENLFG